MTKDKQTSNTKLAVISCIHGNMEALEAVYDDICSQGIEKVMCLGDLIGYGPYPNEVVEFIERKNISTVLGCWDEGIANDNPTCGCNYISDEESALGALAFTWTKAFVTKKTQNFLKQIPFGVRRDLLCGETLFVHGSPQSTSEYLLDSTHELVLFERAASGECEILVCGHTHVPYVKEVSGTLTVKSRQTISTPNPKPKKVTLSPKLIINAGSVGEPRHGGTEATYVVLDVVTGEATIRYVEYNYKKTAQAMKKMLVPEVFIDRFLSAQELTGKEKSIHCAC